MKKLLFIVVLLALLLLAYFAGTQAGGNNAADVISRMEIWSGPDWEGEYRDGKWWYRSDDPGDSDGTLLIYLDGEWYEHHLFVG